MVQISPFRGWRYDLSQVGDLSDVVAPPYDVIDPPFLDSLYERHPCNIVRIDFNREEPGDSEDERYVRAADFWKHWRLDGVLQREHEESLYVYHQEYEWEGATYIRRGFLARLQLEEFGTGQVFPHEQTLSGPKLDRLKLTRACRANLSPIFGLYPDSNCVTQDALDEASRNLTSYEATDHLGVRHRLWVVQSPAVINQVRNGLAEMPVFIADGHHRYETALNYRREVEAAGQLSGPMAAENYVLTHLVPMGDPGLLILPTHRLLSGWPDLTAEQLRAILAPHFEVETFGKGPDEARQVWEVVSGDGDQGVFGFGTSDGYWTHARLTDSSPMQDLAADHSEAWRELGVSILHKLVIEHLLTPALQNAKPSIKYVHRLDEATDTLAAGGCQLACLVPPATMTHVEDIAGQRETMPPKSTYFYPKLLTGMVINSFT